MDDKKEFCLCYECPIEEVTSDMIYVCKCLGDSCDSCDHRA